jgi:large subunit ribosomal protein L3
LTVVGVDTVNNAILVKGAIPGPRKSIVTIRSAVKAQKSKPVVKPLVNYTPAVAEVVEGGEEK